MIFSLSLDNLSWNTLSEKKVEYKKLCFFGEWQRGGEKRFLLFWFSKISEYFDRFGFLKKQKFKERKLDCFSKKISGHIIPLCKIPHWVPITFRKILKVLKMVSVAQSRYPTLVK